jgi:hypothetical protein
MMSGRRSAIVLPLLVLVALALQLVSQLTAPAGCHSIEELFNAAHALIIRDGGWDLAWPFRYQMECGGCAVVAGIGAVLFDFVEPSIAAWRSIGLLFFAVAVVAGSVVGYRVARVPGAAAVVLSFCAAPPAYQQLSFYVHGNHTEGGVWLLVELLFGVLAITASTPLRRTLAFCVFLVLVGLGIPFLLSLQLGLVFPLLVILLSIGTLWERFLLWPILLAGATGAGLLPYRALFRSLAAEGAGSHESGEIVLSFSYLTRNLDTLIAPTQVRGIWGSPDGPWEGRLGLLAFAAFLLLFCYAAGSLLVSLPRRGGWTGEDRALLLTLSAVGMFVGLYLVFERQIGGSGGPPSPGQVRYLGFIYPTVVCCGALAGAKLWLRGGGGRFVGLLLLCALFAPGLTARATAAQTLLAEGNPTLSRYAPASAYAADVLGRVGGPRDRLRHVGRLDFAAMAEGRESIRSERQGDLSVEELQNESFAFGVLREMMGAGYDSDRPLGEYVVAFDPAPERAGQEGFLMNLGVAASRSDGANSFDDLFLRTLWTFQRTALRYAHFRWTAASPLPAGPSDRASMSLLVRSVGAGFGMEPSPLARIVDGSLVLPPGATELWTRFVPPSENLIDWSWGWGWGLGAELGHRKGPEVERVIIHVGLPSSEEDLPDLDLLTAALERGFSQGYSYGSWLDWIGPRGEGLPQVEIRLTAVAEVE